LAAYHFTSKIHSRAKGASAVRAAAYRAGERLVDERAGATEDYSRKSDVVEAAILLPAGAPPWMVDRSRLWNAVEAREKRRDAQVAQEFEINLPREFSDAENWRLITDFCRAHLVAPEGRPGRACDIAFHNPTAGDGQAHPHAHLLLPLRVIEGDGFAAKHPDADWRLFLDRRDRLEELRALWADFARQRALELGIDLGADWTHLSLADRGIDLEGQPKVGATAQRLERASRAADRAVSDRAAEFERVRRENGCRLIARPEIALEAITQRQSTFTEADLARWVHAHAADDQFQPVMALVRGRMVEVGRDERDRPRYSTREMIALEVRMVDGAQELAKRAWHGLRKPDRLGHTRLSEEQRDAARALIEDGDLTCLVGYAGAGKSTLLGEVRTELEASGYRLRGASLSGISAEGLENGSGIAARTVASLFHAWDEGRDRLESTDVLVIDEAGMLGSRALARLVETAREAKAKLILVGDPEQLQAIEAGAAFRAIAERTGAAHLTEIRRQKEEWQREATRELATGRTVEALTRYAEAGALVRAATDSDARTELVDRWQAARAAKPKASRIMLTHKRVDVEALNGLARAALKADGQLENGQILDTVHGEREFAAGDRLLFLRNERQLEVKNGTLGTVVEMEPGKLMVRTDDGRMVHFDPASYPDFGHGYATTIHKAQGVTVDEAFVLASRGFDRHLSYVAMSRHRERLTLVHSDDSFPNDIELHRILGRERQKDTTLDYSESALPKPLPLPKPLALDMPAPAPTAEFIREHSEPVRTDPPERELTELERLYHDMREQALAREQNRDRERRLDRDLGL